MESNQSTAILKEIGLSEQEINVYIGLLKTGGSDATTLANEIGIKRTTVYPILEKLISSEIVTSLEQGKKRLFVPIKPSKLISLYERKVQTLSKIVPMLENMQGKLTEGYGVRFIRSKKEFETFYENVIDEYRGREYFIIGNAGAWLNIDRDFLIDFRKRRAAANISAKILLSSDSKGEQGQQDKSLLRDFKYLPEKYIFKSTIDIYDDKVIIIGPEVKAMAVVIDIPPMVDIFRSIFMALWEALPA